MTNQDQEGVLMKAVRWALDVALNGRGKFKSAEELANVFIRNKSYIDDEERIRALIRSQCWMSAGSGFVTGLGGGIPAILGGAAVDMVSVLGLNLRMVGAIAIIRGYDFEDELVRVAMLLTAIGSSMEEAVGNVGIQLGKEGCKVLIHKLPQKIIDRINKFFGRVIVTKFGKKGLVQLGKAVPFVGGAIGGAVNAVGCRSIGKLACKAFPAKAVA